MGPKENSKINPPSPPSNTNKDQECSFLESKKLISENLAALKKDLTQ